MLLYFLSRDTGFFLRNLILFQIDLYATQILFSITREKPYLVFSTPTSKIIILDIRTMILVYKFQNDVMHGVPLTFTIDQKQTWLILGTSKGVLDRSSKPLNNS